MKQVTMIITTAITVSYDETLEEQETIENETVKTLQSFVNNLDEYVDLPSSVAYFKEASVGLFTVLPTPTL